MMTALHYSGHYNVAKDQSKPGQETWERNADDEFQIKTNEAGGGHPELSVKRVWPTSLLTWSRLRRAVTSQLGTQGRHVGATRRHLFGCELNKSQISHFMAR